MKSLSTIGVFLGAIAASPLLFAAESSWISVGDIAGLAALVAVITGFALSRRKQISEEKTSEVARLTLRIDKLEASNDTHIKEKIEYLEECAIEKAAMQQTVSEMKAEIKVLKESLAELHKVSRAEARSDAASETASGAIDVARETLAGVVKEAAKPPSPKHTVTKVTGADNAVEVKIDEVGKDVKEVSVDVKAIRHEVTEGVAEGVRVAGENDKEKS